MGFAAESWSVVVFVLHLAAAAACVIAAGWTLQKGDPSRPERIPTLIALCVTGLWSVLAAAFGSASAIASLSEILRNLAWVFVIYRLFGTGGRRRAFSPVRPVVLVLAFLELSQPLFVLMTARTEAGEFAIIAFQISALFRVLFSIGVLVLLYNLFAGRSEASGTVRRWCVAGIAILFAAEFLYYLTVYVAPMVGSYLAAARAVAALIGAVLVTLGASTRPGALQFRPSRTVTFRTLSLFAIGLYLLAMMAIAHSLRLIDGELGRLVQVGFVLAATVVALLWLPSARTRGWLRVTLFKHFFQHRYDYREEWLRFTRTIGNAGGESAPLQQRAVKALSDITGSPGGLLLLPGEDGRLEFCEHWQWRSGAAEAGDLPLEFVRVLERERYIFEIDELRDGPAEKVALPRAPEWLARLDDAWALVPLLHYDKLMGAVILARPPHRRRLDWEDLDLLRVVGQQLASYLAEQAGQEALMEASRFDEFNRRIAFVMHDIKNLASQLSLLARNAEKHAGNPAFRADMLVTLRASADKLNNLLARLGRYGTGRTDKREAVDLARVARRIEAMHDDPSKVVIAHCETSNVLADEEGLEQALAHIVQNAIDASEADVPVQLHVSCDGMNGRIEVIDSGCGMSPQFIRTRLFKPFVSSKQGGFGIGAFEARELIRAMGGSLEVDSREGLGSRFIVSLPLEAAVELYSRNNRAEVA